MKCPNCGTEQPKNAKFCRKCGFRLDGMTCPRCGNPVPSGARYCEVCGADLGAGRRKGSRKPKGKKSLLKKVLIVALVLVVVAGGAAGLLLSGVLSLGEQALEIVQENVIQYDNGDTVYRQGTENLAIDEDTCLIYYDNLLIVFTLSDLSDAEAEALADEVGGTVAGDISGCINVLQILVPSTDLETLNKYADTLMASDDVLYASYDMPMTIDATDDNPWSDDGTTIADKGDESNPDGNDWWAEAIGAYTAWEIVDSLSSDSLTDITIGILDNGFDTDHADLSDKITVLNDNSVEDDHHGTLVTGVIGAANNNIGIRGIADNATLLAVDRMVVSRDEDGTILTDDDGETLYDSVDIMELTKLLVEGGARVINNSWGRSSLSQLSKVADELLDALANYRENDPTREKYELMLETYAQESATLTIQMMYQLYINGFLGGDTDILFVQSAGNGYVDKLYLTGKIEVGEDWENWKDWEVESIATGGHDAELNGYYCSITEERFEASIPALSATADMDTGLIILGYDDSFDYEFVKGHILIVGSVENEVTESGAYNMVKNFNYGDVVDICAPGASIYTTGADSGYTTTGGTSLSAPMVSAAAALVWSVNPDLTAGEVKSILTSTAGVAVGVNDEDAGNTYPMLNVGSAVLQIVQAASGTITGTIVSASDGSTAIGGASVTVLDGDTVVEELTSDENGVFEAELPQGTYTVQIEMEGYESQTEEVTIEAGEESTLLVSLSAEITDADARADELFERYINNVLIPEYGLLQTGATTEMSSDESDTGVWLQSGVMTSVIEDLDGDGTEECMVFLLVREKEDGEDGVALYANIYEIAGGEVALSDSMYLDRIDDSDWYQHGWNGSLVDVDGSLYFILETCEWPNEYYAMELNRSVNDMTYSVEEAYMVYAYDGETLEKTHAYQKDGGVAYGGVEYYEYVYENGEVSDSNWLYSSINAAEVDKSGMVYDTYIEAIEYFAGVYNLSVDETLMSDTGRYWANMSESIFLDSDRLTRLFAHSVLTEDKESPYTYEQTFIDDTDKNQSEYDQETDDSDTEIEDGTPNEASRKAAVSDIVLDTAYTDDYYEFGNIYAYDSNGNLVWSYETGSYPATELDAISEIGLRDGRYYFVEGGTVVAMDASTGAVLWENSDFGSYGASAAFAENCICLAGYYGPDFYAVSYGGTTLCEISSFGSEYYWASNVTISGNTALVSLNDGYCEAQIDLATWSYAISDAG